MERKTRPGLVRVHVVARRLGVSKQRAYELTRRGILPVIKIGASYRYDMAQVEKFIQDGGNAGEEAASGERARGPPG